MRVDLAELLVLSAVMVAVGGFVGSIGTAAVLGTLGAIVAPLRALLRQRANEDAWITSWGGHDLRLVRDRDHVALWVDGVKSAEQEGNLPSLLVAKLRGAGDRVAAEVRPDGRGGFEGRLYANGQWIGGDRLASPTEGPPAAMAESLPLPSDARWEAALHLLDDLAVSTAVGAPYAAGHFALALRTLFHRLERLSASEAAHATLGTPEPAVATLRERLEQEIGRVVEDLRTVHLQLLSSDGPPSMDAVNDAVARLGAILEADERLPRTPLPASAAPPAPRKGTTAR